MQYGSVGAGDELSEQLGAKPQEEVYPKKSRGFVSYALHFFYLYATFILDWEPPRIWENPQEPFSSGASHFQRLQGGDVR